MKEKTQYKKHKETKHFKNHTLTNREAKSTVQPSAHQRIRHRSAIFP